MHFLQDFIGKFLSLQDRIQKVTRNSKSEAYFAVSFQMGKVSALPILFLYFHLEWFGFFVLSFLVKKKREGFKEKLWQTQEGSIWKQARRWNYFTISLPQVGLWWKTLMQVRLVDQVKAGVTLAEFCDFELRGGASDVWRSL